MIITIIIISVFITTIMSIIPIEYLCRYFTDDFWLNSLMIATALGGSTTRSSSSSPLACWAWPRRTFSFGYCHQARAALTAWGISGFTPGRSMAIVPYCYVSIHHILSYYDLQVLPIDHEHSYYYYYILLLYIITIIMMIFSIIYYHYLVVSENTGTPQSSIFDWDCPS